MAACIPLSGAGTIGVNYGVLGNNLPTPAATTKLILSTTIRNVKLYNTDPATLQSFANTGIKVIVSAGNDNIPLLASSLASSQSWVQTNVAAYMPATQIIAIALGNEVLMTNPELAGQLVTALVNVHTSLVNLKLDATVKVSSPQSLGVLSKSYPPSQGVFKENFTSTFKDLLSFHQQTMSPLMVNAYPYFAYTATPNNVSVNYALFQTNAGVTDLNTGLHYGNILDAQLDAVYSAMASLGYTDVNLLVSETGWPSGGGPDEIGASVPFAQLYNENLIQHITLNTGTPLRPNASIDTYIFALYNENLKPGAVSERFYGLFNVDQSPVYNVGLTGGSTRNPPPAAPSPVGGVASPPLQTPSMPLPPNSQPLPPLASAPPPLSVPSSPAPPAAPSTSPQGKTWCVAKAGAPEQDMLNALNYACGVGTTDCSAIQPGAMCYFPNTLVAHASFAFNEYYHKFGANYYNCYFNGTAIISNSDPSYAGCTFA